MWLEWLTAWCTCHGNSRCRKHHTQPTEWKRSSLGTTNSKIFTKIKDDIRKACKAGRLNVSWKLSKEHYGCYSSVPWPLNVGQWAPACSCGWHLRSRFKPDSHEPAPSQASQGRFCSTKIIRGIRGRQVALSLVRKPKDVKNAMRIATLISVHQAPKVQGMLLHIELTLIRLSSRSFTGKWWGSDAKRKGICASKYWGKSLNFGVSMCIFSCWTGK